MKFMVLYQMGKEIITATGTKEEVMEKARELEKLGISSQIYTEDKIEKIREFLKSKSYSNQVVN